MIEVVMVLVLVALPAVLGFAGGRRVVLLVPVALAALLVAITLPDALTPPSDGSGEPNIAGIHLVAGLAMAAVGFVLCLVGVLGNDRRSARR
jgi:hypothetical protein